jgi:transposase
VIIEDPASCLPEEARATLLVLIETKTRLDGQMAKLNAEISRRAKENEVACRLMMISGIGPLIATALVALAPPETSAEGAILQRRAASTPLA